MNELHARILDRSDCLLRAREVLVELRGGLTRTGGRASLCIRSSDGRREDAEVQGVVALLDELETLVLRHERVLAGALALCFLGGQQRSDAVGSLGSLGCELAVRLGYEGHERAVLDATRHGVALPRRLARQGDIGRLSARLGSCVDRLCRSQRCLGDEREVGRRRAIRVESGFGSLEAVRRISVGREGVAQALTHSRELGPPIHAARGRSGGGAGTLRGGSEGREVSGRHGIDVDCALLILGDAQHNGVRLGCGGDGLAQRRSARIRRGLICAVASGERVDGGDDGHELAHCVVPPLLLGGAVPVRDGVDLRLERGRDDELCVVHGRLCGVDHQGVVLERGRVGAAR